MAKNEAMLKHNSFDKAAIDGDFFGDIPKIHFARKTSSERVLQAAGQLTKSYRGGARVGAGVLHHAGRARIAKATLLHEDIAILSQVRAQHQLALEQSIALSQSATARSYRFGSLSGARAQKLFAQYLSKYFEASIWAIIAISSLINLATGMLFDDLPFSSLALLLGAAPMTIISILKHKGKDA